MSRRRKICFVTGTRADYGILSPLMKMLKDDSRVQLQIIATNMHLSPDFGLTYREIEADGFVIDKKVEMLLSGDTPTATVKSMGLASVGCADAFQELSPDLLVILGDRYEMLAVASAANIFGIPVAHLHGGEITEGAYDDSIRHAITKLSYLHFTSTEEYRRRVIQMGESPDRVFFTGSIGAAIPGAEHTMPLPELESGIGFALGEKFIIVTYHPVTNEPGTAAAQAAALLNALNRYADGFRILFTLPNSDTGGRVIAKMIGEWTLNHKDKAFAVKSLGRERFYSALSHCTAMVGNSSAGLIEAPSFFKPTLNIGNRQKGRAQGNTVINCEATEDAIVEGLRKTLSSDFIEFVKQKGINPYVKHGTLQEIADVLHTFPIKIPAVKTFYDLK